VRVIAATNKKIEREIAEKRFREDLYFRLNVIPIIVPPLRDRLEDLPELINYFVIKFKNPARAEPRRFSEDALKELTNYYWPGNIRELKNFIERVNIMVEDHAVNKYLGRKRNDDTQMRLASFQGMKLNDAKDAFEREFITTKLKEYSYNISKTAQGLGIYPSNLHGKIKKLGIDVKR